MTRRLRRPSTLLAGTRIWATSASASGRRPTEGLTTIGWYAARDAMPPPHEESVALPVASGVGALGRPPTARPSHALLASPYARSRAIPRC